MKSANCLGKLEGVWKGLGKVMVHGKEIPYNEHTEIKLLKTAPCHIFNVQQYTKHAQNGNPMHAENGFLKVFADNKCEVSFSHPFGMNEFEFGHLDGDKIELVADQEHHFQRPKIVTDDTLKAKQVTYVKRVYTCLDNELHFDMWLGIGGQEPYHHLHCAMKRQ